MSLNKCDIHSFEQTSNLELKFVVNISKHSHTQ